LRRRGHDEPAERVRHHRVIHQPFRLLDEAHELGGVVGEPLPLFLRREQADDRPRVEEVCPRLRFDRPIEPLGRRPQFVPPPRFRQSLAGDRRHQPGRDPRRRDRRLGVDQLERLPATVQRPRQRRPRQPRPDDGEVWCHRWCCRDGSRRRSIHFRGVCDSSTSGLTVYFNYLIAQPGFVPIRRMPHRFCGFAGLYQGVEISKSDSSCGGSQFRKRGVALQEEVELGGPKALFSTSQALSRILPLKSKLNEL
jgi:hypothetical protein